jgi:hypothetical protein
VDPGVERFQGEGVLEVNIRDEGYRRMRNDVRESRRGFTVWDRDPDDFAPRLRQFVNLSQRGNGVPGVRGSH